MIQNNKSRCIKEEKFQVIFIMSISTGPDWMQQPQHPVQSCSQKFQLWPQFCHLHFASCAAHIVHRTWHRYDEENSNCVALNMHKGKGTMLQGDSSTFVKKWPRTGAKPQEHFGRWNQQERQTTSRRRHASHSTRITWTRQLLKACIFAALLNKRILSVLSQR